MKYSFKVIDKEGNTLKGYKQSKNKKEVFEYLETNGYYVLEIKERKNALANGDKIKDKDIYMIANQIHILLDSGIPIREALRILLDENNNIAVNNMLERLILDLEDGIPISKILKKYEYPSLFTNIIKSGEESGNLADSFLKVSKYYKKRYNLKSNIFSKLTYPFLLLVSTILLIFFLVIGVIPQILSLYDYNIEDLPKPTLYLIKSIEIILKIKNIILIMIFISILLLIYSYRKYTYYFHRVIYKLPYISKYIKKINSLKFFITQNILISSGVTLLRSVELSIKNIGNIYVKEELENILKNIESGKKFSEELENKDIFSSILIPIIRVGEESGDMIYSTYKIIEFLEEDIIKDTEKIISIIEPLVLIIISIVIGGIVISVITPMFEITKLIN